MSYVLSRKAEEDVIGIFETGVEQFGLSQAERYHKQLGQCFRFLAENPLAAHERFEITASSSRPPYWITPGYLQSRRKWDDLHNSCSSRA
jgi:plasmid stabilization system protein ParE